MSLQGRVVLITGGSAGIGKHVAARLGKEGARLVLAARSADTLQQAVDEFTADGIEAVGVPTDVSDPDGLSKLVETAIVKFGQIDVLVNNAGIDCYYPFEQLEVEQILSTIETNLTGTILLTRFVIPHMLQRSRGTIINLASTAGKHCPGFASVYGATKAGQIAFTQGLRGEYLDRGISATAVCPGFTRNGGIYDRIVQLTGKKTPFALGGTTADAVAAAVVKGIMKGPPEIVVNWPPVRPAIALKEVFPRLGEILCMLASKKFSKRIASANAAASTDVEKQ